MSKQKDIEKIKPEKEQIEKIKPEKERIKFEKLEKQEFKDFKEPIKEKVEHKEKPEKREIKEKIEKFEKEHTKPEKREKEYLKNEQKELINETVKDFSTEGPGKELVEGPGDPGDIFFTRAASEQADAASAAKQKEHEKLPKELEKIKPEKEQIKTESKDHKFEKVEIKEHKNEKLEIKEKIEKIEKPEKFEKEHSKPEKREKEVIKIEFKEFKLEINETVKDFSTEGPGKELVEGPGDPGDRINPFKGTGTPEDRLGELEDAVTRLSHFIGVDLRPDLSAGALNREPDVSAEKEAKSDQAGGPGKADDKTKKS